MTYKNNNLAIADTLFYYLKYKAFRRPLLLCSFIIKHITLISIIEFEMPGNYLSCCWPFWTVLVING